MLGGLVSLLVVQGYVLPALLATATSRKPAAGQRSLPPNPCPADETSAIRRESHRCQRRTPLSWVSRLPPPSFMAACGSVSAPAEEAPATLKPVAGSSVQQVQLSAAATHRLGIETKPVQMAAGADSGRPGHAHGDPVLGGRVRH